MDNRNYMPKSFRHVNLWLLLSLLASLLVSPLTDQFSFGRILFLAALTICFVASAAAVRPRLRILIGVFLLVIVPITWTTVAVDSKQLLIVQCLLASLLLWFVGGLIVHTVLRTSIVTVDSVFGAISAYLLFGLAWALSYQAIHIGAASAFHISQFEEASPAAGKGISQFVYYSFVTMTTLGFGDITPVGQLARTLTWIQAVIGQFYVAVVIAWLVSALPRPPSQGDSA